MNNEKLILHVNEFSDNLLSSLESRDIALWIRGIPDSPPTGNKLADFLSLPWKLVISEVSDTKFFHTLELQSNTDVPMTHKRGFVQIIESDPYV